MNYQEFPEGNPLLPSLSYINNFSSRGRKGDQYLMNRVDKGCFLYKPQQVSVTQDKQTITPIGLVARVKAPYAVLLKT